MCKLCPKYKTCKELCEKMLEMLANKRTTNGIYSDTIESFMNVHLDENILDKILYTHSLSMDESSKVQKIIIAILTPEQKAVINLIAEGKNQKEIADILHISQSAVSQKLATIKKELKSQFTDIIDYIL